MLIRGLPNGVRHTRPQAGRDHPQQVVAINRSAWSRSPAASNARLRLSGITPSPSKSKFDGLLK